MANSSKDLSLWMVLFLIALGLVLFFGLRCLIHHKEEEISCVNGKLTVCVGDTENFGVPTCYDFPLDKYKYKQYSDHFVVVNKENSPDVVNYPSKKLISATKYGCKED